MDTWVPMTIKLAFQERRPDGSHDIVSARAGEPFRRSLGGKSAPVFFLFQVKRHQAKTQSPGQAAGLEPEQIPWSRERMDAAAKVNAHRAFAPHQFVGKTKFPHQPENRRVGEKQGEGRPFPGSCRERETRPPGRQAAGAFHHGDGAIRFLGHFQAAVDPVKPPPMISIFLGSAIQFWREDLRKDISRFRLYWSRTTTTIVASLARYLFHPSRSTVA